jgi:hypothetical protein
MIIHLKFDNIILSVINLGHLISETLNGNKAVHQSKIKKILRI